MKLLQDTSTGHDISSALLLEFPPEMEVVKAARHRIDAVKAFHPRAQATAAMWIDGMRETTLSWSSIERIVQDFPLDSSEGMALMRLAECYLRTPDHTNRAMLLADLLSPFRQEQVHTNWLGRILGQVASFEEHATHGCANWMERLADPLVLGATEKSIRKMGNQFLLAQTIDDALARSKKALCSFDMLGEGARTQEDADRYFESYLQAAKQIQIDSRATPQKPGNHSLSIKLSALSAQFTDLKRAQCLPDLSNRVFDLATQTLPFGIDLTIDAEENSRLILSLEILEATAERINQESAFHGTKTGRLGLAVQAYNRRSLHVIDHLIRWAKEHYPGLQVRLVKGAYWDTEIALAQREGFSDYPVFTTRAGTDLQYLACAFTLLAARPHVYPMLASHNALTLATVLEYAQACGPRKLDGFECQRLHGMGESLWAQVRMVPEYNLLTCRIYSPVGGYDSALAYLVRRLLENGANSSFVNALHNRKSSPERLFQDPLTEFDNHRETFESGLKRPADLFPGRCNSPGVALHNRQQQNELSGTLKTLDTSWPLDNPPTWESLSNSMERIVHAQRDWEQIGAKRREVTLCKWAKMVEENRNELIALLMHEAGKTIADAVAEWREAIDFIYHYSANASSLLDQATVLPGPAGELNQLYWRARGQCLCISPWNFPLAIFIGQIACSLAGGNSVLAKAAPQTQRIAQRVVDMAVQAGLDSHLITLLGPDNELVKRVIKLWPVNAVMFTGGNATARQIQLALAQRKGPIVPLIAETGGVNAMIVDSTALPEQACDAIVQSAFGSAGQRCSALRIVFVQREVSDQLLKMVKGAVRMLNRAPNTQLDTDFGPLIDRQSRDHLQFGLDELAATGKVWQPENTAPGCFGPFIVERNYPGDLSTEWFGPILQWVSFESNQWDDLLQAIASSGWGLTLGLQSRLDARAMELKELPVGNLYINRPMTGAVVGSQPFGGQGLSGTGPKSGGFHTLFGVMVERCTSNNLASAGGIPELFKAN